MSAGRPQDDAQEGAQADQESQPQPTGLDSTARGVRGGASPVPKYIRKSFWVKSFSLISVQFAAVLVLMLLVEFLFPWKALGRRSIGTQSIFILLGFMTTLLLVALYVLQRRHPINYVLLLAVTVLVGLSWGLACSFLTGQLHFHLIGIMAVAMPVTTATSAALSPSGMSPWKLVVAAQLSGWVVGSLMDAMAMVIISDIPPTSVLTAVLVTLFLSLVMLADVGTLLVRGDPDDFMRVSIGMSSALLVVVSIPIFIWWFACMYCCALWRRQAAAERAADVAARVEARGQGGGGDQRRGARGPGGGPAPV